MQEWLRAVAGGPGGRAADVTVSGSCSPGLPTASGRGCREKNHLLLRSCLASGQSVFLETRGLCEPPPGGSSMRLQGSPQKPLT